MTQDQIYEREIRVECVQIARDIMYIDDQELIKKAEEIYEFVTTNKEDLEIRMHCVQIAINLTSRDLIKKAQEIYEFVTATK